MSVRVALFWLVAIFAFCACDHVVTVGEYRRAIDGGGTRDDSGPQ